MTPLSKLLVANGVPAKNLKPASTSGGNRRDVSARRSGAYAKPRWIHKENVMTETTKTTSKIRNFFAQTGAKGMTVLKATPGAVKTGAKYTWKGTKYLLENAVFAAVAGLPATLAATALWSVPFLATWAAGAGVGTALILGYDGAMKVVGKMKGLGSEIKARYASYKEARAEKKAAKANNVVAIAQ